MGVRAKVIGRVPTDHGEHVPGQAYGEKYQVTKFGCVWESKHNNNTTAPATLNQQTGTITENTTDWKKVTGSYDQWLMDNGYKNVSAKNVTDGNHTQHDINETFSTEIGADDVPASIKGRIKTIEQSKGAAGGIATLDSGGKVPASQLPSMNYVPNSEKGANGGVATLDNSGKVPSSQLPSYVDDVIDLLDIAETAPEHCAEGDKYYNSTSKKIFTATGTDTWGGTGADPESGKIYITLDDNKEYRWSGTTMAEISKSLALGETASTAFAGDRGVAIENKIPSAANPSNKLVDSTSMQSALSGKANTSDVNAALAGKANSSDVYTKSQIDNQYYTVAEGQQLESDVQSAIAAQDDEIDRRMDAQDTTISDTLAEQQAKLETLDGHDVIPVPSIPSSGESNKVYRVYGATSYTDYMFKADALTTPIPIATYDYPGVETTPTKDSQKLISSGGVYNHTKELFEEYETIDIPFTGYFLNGQGEEVEWSEGACTDFIPVEEGDEIVFNSFNQISSRLIGYDQNKQNPVILSTRSTALHWYVTSGTKFIRASSAKNETTKYLHILNNKTYRNTVDKMSEVISEKADGFETGAITGKAIDVNGNVVETPAGKYKEFTVYKGTKIKIVSGLYHNRSTVIGKKVSSTFFTPLLIGSQISELPYEYICEESMVVGISAYEGGVIDILITTNYGKSALTEIDAVYDYAKGLSNIQSILDIELGFLFNKIAVIGDSMAAATMDGYQPTLGSAWLSFLAKRWDCQDKAFYAQGGSQCYTWLNNIYWGLGKFLSDETIYNCYFIAYGHNDNKTVGEATDEAAPVTIIDGVPSCPDGYSFCAYYKAIINQIRAKAPHAMIFCLSQYDYSVAPGGWHSEYGKAVIEIAEWYYNNGDKLVHHLDTGGVPDSAMELGGHYSTIGYAYIAKRVNEEANKVIYQYREDEEIKSFGVYNL